MSKTTFIEKMLDSGCLVKLSHCFENKGPANIPSCLYYGTGHGHAVIPMEEEGDPLLWIMAAMTAAYAEHGPFVELGFVSDAFGREFADSEEMIESLTNMEGTLGEQHASDPSAPVKEVLVAYAVFGDGGEAGGLTEYRYGDDGIPKFEVPIVSDADEQGGVIPLVLRSFYSFLQTLPDKG